MKEKKLAVLAFAFSLILVVFAVCCIFMIPNLFLHKMAASSKDEKIMNVYYENPTLFAEIVEELIKAQTKDITIDLLEGINVSYGTFELSADFYTILEELKQNSPSSRLFFSSIHKKDNVIEFRIDENSYAIVYALEGTTPKYLPQYQSYRKELADNWYYFRIR